MNTRVFDLKNELLRKVDTENGLHVFMFDLWEFDKFISKNNILEVVDFLMSCSYLVLDHVKSKNHPLYRDILKSLQEERRCNLQVDKTLDDDDEKYLTGNPETMSLYKREIVQGNQILFRIQFFGGRSIQKKHERILMKAATNKTINNNRAQSKIATIKHQSMPDKNNRFADVICAPISPTSVPVTLIPAPAAVFFQAADTRTSIPLPKSDGNTEAVTTINPKRVNSFVDNHFSNN